MAQQLIDQKLESLRRCLARIESRLPETPEQLQRDIDAQDIIALNLTRAVQTCADMAAHRIADHPEITAPQTLGQSFERLAQAGIIPDGMATSLRKAVGFRGLEHRILALPSSIGRFQSLRPGNERLSKAASRPAAAGRWAGSTSGVSGPGPP